MNQFPYLYPHSLSEAERLNEEELWQDNRDAEVSHTQLTEMFRHSDPAALMDEAEQAQLAELDDTVTVYRGVTTINSDNLLALSWTLDYETADWFARRFDEDGTVYKAQIDKEHIIRSLKWSGFRQKNFPSGLMNCLTAWTRRMLALLLRRREKTPVSSAPTSGLNSSTRQLKLR